MEQSLPVTVAAAGLLFFFPPFLQSQCNSLLFSCWTKEHPSAKHWPPAFQSINSRTGISFHNDYNHYNLVLYHSNFLKFLHFCKRNISGFKHKMVSVTSRFYTFLCADHALLSTVAQQFPKLSHQEACIKGKGMKPYLGSTFSLVWLSTTPIHKPCLCINTVLGMRLWTLMKLASAPH